LTLARSDCTILKAILKEIIVNVSSVGLVGVMKGGLVEKEEFMSDTNTSHEVVRSTCALCLALCGVLVHMEDGRPVKVVGDPESPVSKGALCVKARRSFDRLFHPDRLKYPLKRVGERGEGKWQRISWDEAMDTIVERLKEIIATDGARAIGFLKGQGAGWESSYEYSQRFVNLIGTPNLATTGYNCHFGKGIGHVLTYGWMADPDWDNTRLMVLWGYNPVNTDMTHGRRIMKAKHRGAKLIVIDPRFTKTAAKADIFVQLRPGSDLALALGMMNVIIGENLYDKEFLDKWTYGFDQLAEIVKQYPPEKVEEITWVPAKTIRQVAQMYATIKPACLFSQNGVDQIPNASQIGRAHSILHSITGNLNVPGGIVLDPEAKPPFTPRRSMAARKTNPEDIRAAFDNSISRHQVYYAMGYLGAPELDDAMISGKPYPIKAVIVQSHNPATTSPNTAMVREALRKVPFLVVFGVEMNPTAQLADIVLPAATFLERDLLVEWSLGGKPKLDEVPYQLQRKAVEPLGESKSDYDFFAELARKLGYEMEWPWKSIEEYTDYILEPEGITFKELVNNPEDVVKRRHTPKHLYQDSLEKCLSLPYFPHHKIALYSEYLESFGLDPLPIYVEPAETPLSRPDLLKEYPLVCVASLKPGLYVHSQYRNLPWLKEIMPAPFVEIHSEKAKELGIEDGDMVVVKSPRASIELKAQVFDAWDTRVVGVTHGWWEPATNLLTPNKYPEFRDPVSGATSNRCFLVNVTKK